MFRACESAEFDGNEKPHLRNHLVLHFPRSVFAPRAALLCMLTSKYGILQLLLISLLWDLFPCSEIQEINKKYLIFTVFFLLFSLKTCNSLTFLHHISFVHILSCLMPANSCHGDSKVLGEEGGVADVRKSKHIDSHKGSNDKTNKGVYLLH